MDEGATWHAFPLLTWMMPDDSPNTNLGTSSNMEISDRETTAPGNISQANSVNLEEADRVEDTP